MLDRIKADFRAVFEMDPAATSRLEVLFTYAGFHAILFYRVSHWFHSMGMPFFARLLSQTARFLTGIEIHPGAKIAGSFFIDHGMGVVIGETSEIGEHVVLFQGVTLGGTGKERGKRHPTIGNHVVVGAGSKVLGAITIGDHVKIGANAVVLKSVPPHSTVVGVPGRVVKVRGRRASDEAMLDHTHMPDPMLEMFAEMQRRIEKLEQRSSAPAQSRKQQPRKQVKLPFELPEETVEERQSRMARMEKEERKKELYQTRPKTEQKKEGEPAPPAGKVRRRRRRSAKKKDAQAGQAGEAKAVQPVNTGADNSEG